MTQHPACEGVIRLDFVGVWRNVKNRLVGAGLSNLHQRSFCAEDQLWYTDETYNAAQ